MNDSLAELQNAQMQLGAIPQDFDLIRHIVNSKYDRAFVLTQSLTRIVEMSMRKRRRLE